MPQMSNLLWLPLLLYFSIIMFIIISMMFSTMSINNHYKNKVFKIKIKNWLW
uniref:ATP synthase F0 subunit 8 n=1 Tax=Eucriotettix oculatus TaxID=470944 RepID=A0A6G6BJ41_9ORTH|nr:ATP synthase F0 subunit 8 [Eucriotettix oculatus]QPK42101.1 ATP synthase F0 subunit 8 [Eucriotettix oculatus]